MVADDDVDAESLQAQIDVSMSFAHNLVTSWIKPSHLAQLRFSGVDATQVLEEELRRPPRLGVGASVPAIPHLAHEASKLKCRLGKDRAKIEGVVQSQPQGCSKSDDEEHKGRPAKRKVKVDPFGYVHEGSKKRRKAGSEAKPYTSVENDSPHAVLLPNNPTIDLLSLKERVRVGPDDQRPTVPLLSEPSVPALERTAVPESSRAHKDCTPIPDKAKALGIPLLNLGGPPEVRDEPGNDGELNHHKKKRKRRKKKKARTMTGTGDNLNSH